MLAKKVLQGKTKGYKHHPELTRFKGAKEPFKAVGKYLLHIYKEAKSRRYNFDKRKIGAAGKETLIINKTRSLDEFAHLKKKLKKRSPEEYNKLRGIHNPELHPVFKIE